MPEDKKPPKLQGQDEEQNELVNRQLSLEEEIAQGLDEAELKAVKRICYYLGQVGFSMNDACFLSNITEDELKRIIDKEPRVKRIIEIKMLEYKKDLLATLSAKARNGDDKMAQWLLERLFPDEFGSKRSSGDGDGSLIKEAIVFVQESNKSDVLVNPKNNKASQLGPGKEERQSRVKKIFDALK